MTVGFTGTRGGMSQEQAWQLPAVLAWLLAFDADRTSTLFLDGDCPRGADRAARKIAIDMGCRSEPVPPKDTTAAELLARDRVIAARSDVLIAAPLTDQEQLRSGTWYTVRQMRDLRKPVIMLSRGGRKPESDQRLTAALDERCDVMASTIGVEVLSRIDESVRDQMRAYLRRKMRDLLADLLETS